MNNPLARSIAADMAASQVRRPDVERGFEGGGGDLSSREAELARREAELRRREQGGAAPPQGMEKKRNWPVYVPAEKIRIQFGILQQSHLMFSSFRNNSCLSLLVS